MDLGGKNVKLTLAEWVLRRRELAGMERAAWESLTDNGLRDQRMKLSNGEGHKDVKVVRYFDPQERDRQVELFKHEPGMIDRNLEVVNATTDLVGYEDAKTDKAQADKG